MFSLTTTLRRHLTACALTTTACAAVAAAAAVPTGASAAVSRPSISSVTAAVWTCAYLPAQPEITVKTRTGTTSSVAVFWAGNRTDATRQGTTWTAPTPGARIGQRLRVQVTASGPGGTATSTRTVRFIRHRFLCPESAPGA